MRILSHRGWWQQPAEKNSVAAIERSYASGFGMETDVRDRLGQLVVSHDPADATARPLSEILAVANDRPELPIALNIKADGLAPLLKRALSDKAGTCWFCFDMSVPEMRQYARERVPFLTRHSDIELHPIMLDQAAGVWIDSFESDWLTEDVVSAHLNAGRLVSIVSPELHGRAHGPFWARLKAMQNTRSDALLLCTDHPADAAAYFTSV